MKRFRRCTICGLLITLAAMGFLWTGTVTASETDVAGNNLSFPVIWAEGETKMLRGAPEMTPVLEGEWWYWWGTSGTDPNIVPLSCPPDPDDVSLCDDGVSDEAKGTPPGDGWVKAYLQKDTGNIWQAGTLDGNGDSVIVDLIDWGDNLESVDWYTRSQVRTEVVLYKVLDSSMLEYGMHHVDGWGIDEVHGLSVNGTPEIGPGTEATIYSPCARLTIQKLLVDREKVDYLDDLVWVPEIGWKEPTGYSIDLINPPIFNKAVHESGDGPGYYNAEINVKGKSSTATHGMCAS